MVIPFNPKNTTYTDLTGRFSYKSTSGNEYIYVMYDWNSNKKMSSENFNKNMGTIASKSHITWALNQVLYYGQ